MNSQKNLVVILGNQLFSVSQVQKAFKTGAEFSVFMREDRELCTYFKFHKHKIIFFLSAMRHFRDELEKQGIQVHYQELSDDGQSYEQALSQFIAKNKVEQVSIFEIEDKFFEKRIIDGLKEQRVPLKILASPMFLTSRSDFKEYLRKSKKPFMKIFYEQQRKNLNILVDQDSQPVGGAWSFDVDNRKALPKSVQPKAIEPSLPNQMTREVQKIVDRVFADHPGRSDNFWLPTDRMGAQKWLDCFLQDRLAQFGPFEDALPTHSDFVFHSVLTPFLNCGLLTPDQVVSQCLAHAAKMDVPLASLEGFVRQVVGWREFIRGIYQNFSKQQESANFFNHHRNLTHHWYEANTGVAPLDDAISKVLKFGYMHHIERLMVVGSLMLLLEIEPSQAHRWFMEMFVDSSDWVMGPNVYGMALFADGGIFATKPYFCGSNYYRKMGPYTADESWCDAVDGLYWGFVEKHKEFFLKNPRLSMMARTVEKMDLDKKKRIFNAADVLRKKITT